MKVLCAWCQHEGTPALLREIEPLDDPGETHGICGSHRRLVMARLVAMRQAEGALDAPAAALEALAAMELRFDLPHWLEQGRYWLGHVVPDLVEEGRRLERRIRAAEDRYAQLREEVSRLQLDRDALRGENQAYRALRLEVAALASLAEQVSTGTLPPMPELIESLSTH